jgi:hypothetical protein
MVGCPQKRLIILIIWLNLIITTRIINNYTIKKNKIDTSSEWVLDTDMAGMMLKRCLNLWLLTHYLGYQTLYLLKLEHLMVLDIDVTDLSSQLLLWT